LDLDLAIEQARAVFDALVHQRPEAADDYRQRMAGLESDLGELDSRLQAIAGRIGQQPLMFSHPVYQYLVRGYELDGRSVHWEPHEMPDDDQWHELSDMLATHQATWMIWEDDPLPETARRLADMGIESVVFRPGGNRPAEGDFLGVMRDNVTALEQAFADDSAPLD
jgi:zinc transport system substrate-binding protein